MSTRFVRRSVLAIAIAAGGWAASAQVTPFKPVTDAMLLDPAPGDWINWRRTLDAWGYSPLTQINRKSVHQLQLVWSWGLPNTGRPEPNPLVYDGVMYIASPLGIVEALDAVTGELKWQHRQDLGNAKPRSIVTTRNIAICGHVHGGYGRYEHQGIPIYNVSVVDEAYRLVNAPTVIDLKV
jgi:alcohol dehydrogenase (cytochrome c)